jgi:O-antigen/teichoic acid export membrane protein
VVLVILARTLDPVAFGLVATAAALIAFAQLLQDMGILQAYVQRPLPAAGDLSTLFWGTSLLGAVLSIVLFALAPSIAGAFNQAALAPVLATMAPVLFLQATALAPSAELERELRFGPIALRRTIGSITGGLTAIALALAGAGAFALVARVLVDATVGTVLLWASVRWMPRLTFSPKRFWEYARFGLPVAGARFLETVQSRSDDLLIARFLGPASLGIYSVAYQLFRILVEVITGSASQVLSPAFARLQHERSRLLSAYYRAVRLTALVTVPIFAGAAAIAGPLITLVFGPQWDDAIPVLQILAVLGIVQSIRYYDAALLIAIGRPKIGLVVRALTVTLTVAGYVIAIQFGNLVAFAVAQVVVAIAVSTPIWLTVLSKTVGVRPLELARRVWSPLTAAAIMSVVVWGMDSGTQLGNAMTLLICIPLGALTYSALLLLLDRSALRELAEIVKSMRGHGGRT